MANQLINLLAQWYPERDSQQWVLGTVYRTEGPSYRKAGAMMLFDSLGRQFGMLSGGCLESDIQRHARRVMQTGRSTTLCYDGSDEDDVSFQLGIGCGGTVWIMLHRIHRDNGYQQLDRVYESLTRRQTGTYYQSIPDDRGENSAYYASGNFAGEKAILQAWGDHRGDCLCMPILPEPHLLVMGGGIDARPVVALAHQLGWIVSVWDPRPANARPEFFLDADHLLRGEAESLRGFVQDQCVNGAVIMTHNIPLDAQALTVLNGLDLDYLALLGPANRKQKVLTHAQLTATDLQQPLSGPAGLPLGGELPESIALSILAECHQRLHESARMRVPTFSAVAS